MKAISLPVVCSVICGFGSLFGVRAGDSLEARFAAPPESSRLQAWWHWCGDNVTKQGIAADLAAMQEMDVGTAHVFSPAMMGPIPGYHVPLLTPKWKEVFAFAVAEAKARGIRLGFHNCPGWSSSGGPWIKPEDSMKVVVSSATDVKAGAASVRLAEPPSKRGFYRDLAVVAFPVAEQPAVVRASGNFAGDFAAFATGRGTVRMPLSRGKDHPVVVTLEYASAFLPTTFVLQFGNSNAVLEGDVEASADGQTWQKLRTFDFHFHADVGDPKYMSLDCPRPVRFFRVTFRPGNVPEWMGGKPFDTNLKAVAFTKVPMIPDLGSCNSSTVSFGYRPAANPDQPGIAKAAFVDLTDKLSPDGTLDLASLWSKGVSRQGTWRLLRIGYTTTGKDCAPATLPGLECDKLSKRGLDAHWPHMPREILNAPGAKGTVSISLIDSYEVGGQNWTEDLPTEFRKRRGYDLRPYLPAIVGYTVGTAGETAKFLFDLQRTVADLFAENYYDYFAELCHREGILAASEAYGGPFDALRCFRTADVPTGEFWLGAIPHGSPRLAASAGHLNGRVQIGAEAFTTEAMPGRWQITPRQLKESGDRGWLEGISQLVYHSYLSQPFMNVKPGLSLGRHGTQLNRHTTWWKEGKGWSAYVRRGQFLLQSGKSRVDAVVLTGDSRPNAAARPESFVKAGYNFDFCGRDDLLRLETQGGQVNMPGQEPYAFLCLGQDRCLTLRLLAKVRSLLKAGARIAAVRPVDSPSLSDDAKVWKALADEIWGGAYKTLVETSDPLVAAKRFGLRPSADSQGRLGALRRRIEGRDFYFLMNDHEEAFEGNVTFAAAGVPMRWDAKTGVIETLPRYRATPGYVTTRFSLPPRGSVFVGFAPAADEATETAPEDTVRYESVTVTKARYYARDNAAMGCDVTENVRRLVQAGTLEFHVGNGTLKVRDPAPDHYKVLEVTFTAGDRKFVKSFAEHCPASLVIPQKPRQRPEPVVAELSSDWTITSFSGVAAPAAPFRLAKLMSWGDTDDARLRHFAGHAVYEKKVSGLAASEGVVLDLGEVRDIATVSIDGKAVACLWEPPYRVKLPQGTPATFVLRVEVVNCWPNRMIGDAIARRSGAAEPKQGGYPEWVLADRPDSGTGIYTWSNFDYGWQATDKLLPAGLIGPVRLVKGRPQHPFPLPLTR